MKSRWLPKVRRRVASAAWSSRGYLAVLTGMLASLGNFAISVAIARTSLIGELGQFAVAFAIYVLGMGIVRSAVVEPMLALSPTQGTFRESARRASLLGMVFGATVLIAGAAFRMPYIAIVGLALHGCVLYDYAKVMSLSAFRAAHGLAQEAGWLLISMVSASLVIVGNIPPVFGFGIWAVGCASIGYFTARLHRLDCRPGWTESGVPTRVAAAFAVDFVVGTGSGQITQSAVSATAGQDVLGSLRAAGTLLGPVGMVITTARTLLIPYLARLMGRSRNPARAAGLMALGLMGLTAPLLVGIVLLPASVGEFVLGDNWNYGKELLPFLSLEMMLIVATTVPFVGHRALLAAKASLVVRVALAVLRVAAVTLAATAYSARGAATAMVVVALVGSIVWWASYLRLLGKRVGA